MEDFIITECMIEEFKTNLIREERAKGTVEKYVRDVKRFVIWLDGRTLTKELVSAWKEHLMEQEYCAATINSMLASIHSFFRFTGIEGCNVKFLKIQRRLFRTREKELNRSEYQKLVNTARAGKNERLALLIEAICATGIRVSEVKYLTIEAIRKGRADISLKGKIRTILIPGKLAKKLKYYAKKKKITTGEVFLTRNGTRMSRKQIWAEMKAICKKREWRHQKYFHTICATYSQEHSIR